MDSCLVCHFRQSSTQPIHLIFFFFLEGGGGYLFFFLNVIVLNIEYALLKKIGRQIIILTSDYLHLCLKVSDGEQFRIGFKTDFL